jgi:hypothetical protein
VGTEGCAYTGGAVKVHQLTTCDEGITNPKRSTFGVTIALR